MNFNLNKNLILIKVYKQEKELLVQLKNVKVNLINNIMQLNKFNLFKEIQILMKYKLLNIFRIKIINILLIIMIFIIE